LHYTGFKAAFTCCGGRTDRCAS